MKKNHVVVALLCFLTVEFASCKKEEVRLASDVISGVLQDVVKEEHITKVAIWREPKNDIAPYWREYYDFSIEGRFMRVGAEYYNLSHLVSYSVDTYRDAEGVEQQMLRLSFGE